MTAAFAIEVIGHNLDVAIDQAERRGGAHTLLRRRNAYQIVCTRQTYWVAEITGRDERFGLARKFVRGRMDFSLASDDASRGVWVWYTLHSGRVYEVQRRTTWEVSERLFVTVDEAGELHRMAREEVDQWLSKLGASPSASTS